VSKAFDRLVEIAPSALKLGMALLSAVGGDEKEALAAIRAIELEQRKARDTRMGRTARSRDGR
jgi:hypothetical protein